MCNNAEFWDILDGDGNKTGRTILRGHQLATGEYHLVVHIWIKDENGFFLIQKRADHLSLYPGMWASTGGSAITGEDSLAAAVRETEEELGIKIRPGQCSLIHSLKRKDSFADVWLVNCTRKEFDNIKICSDVSEYKWATLTQIVDMIRKKLMCNCLYIDDLKS